MAKVAVPPMPWPKRFRFCLSTIELYREIAEAKREAALIASLRQEEPTAMSNAIGKHASREEEIAFLAMEQVLDVDIRLADAGTGDGAPDGVWLCPGGKGRRGIVEVTSPPSARLMRARAAAKRSGLAHSEGGLIPLRLDRLAAVCNEMLAEKWARDNIAKLLTHQADERHLFLFGRAHPEETYFFRISDALRFEASDQNFSAERLDDIVLPAGISAVWFRGRAQREGHDLLGAFSIRLSKFDATSGWSEFGVLLEERQLPAPNPTIADDPVPKDWRRPKDRVLGDALS